MKAPETIKNPLLKPIYAFKNRLYAQSNWAIFATIGFAETIGALVRFPVYGLLNPPSKRPVLTSDAPYIPQSRFTKFFETFVEFISALAIIPGLIVGLCLDVTLGYMLDIHPKRGFSLFEKPYPGSYFFADILNHHNLRLSVVRLSILGLLSASIIVIAAHLAFELFAGAGVLATLSGALPALSIMLPIVFGVGAIGATYGFIKGLGHKLYIDDVKRNYAHASSIINESDSSIATNSVKVIALYYRALNGDVKANKALQLFNEDPQQGEQKIAPDLLVDLEGSGSEGKLRKTKSMIFSDLYAVDSTHFSGDIPGSHNRKKVCLENR